MSANTRRRDFEVHLNSMLEPPRQRQPYTPPPQRPSSIERGPVIRAHLQNELPQGGWESTGICASPSDMHTETTLSGKQKQEAGTSSENMTLGAVLRRAIMDHQLGLAINLFLFVGFAYTLFPSLRPRLDPYARLSYKSELQKGMYSQGPQDLCLVLSFIVFFTGLRAAVLDNVLMPLAKWWGIGRRKGRVRFAEQSYLLIYYAIYWTWGLYLFILDTPASLLTDNESSSSLTINSLLISMWTHYPRLLVHRSMKLYYLSQLAFWVQQILVIHLEDKRKDHYQMLTHHFVTVALLSGSYGYRQLRVGNAVLVCMDIVDLIFPLAKVLRYIGWQTACDAVFALFVVTWLAARHVAYLSICWSIYAHVGVKVMFYGTYSLTQSTMSNGILSALKISSDGGVETWRNLLQPLSNPASTTVQFNEKIKWGFLALLLGLQCITIMWFVMIVRVVIRVLRGEGADDSRSDDEAEGEDEEDMLPSQPSTPSAFADKSPLSEKKFIEVEVSSADMSYSQARLNGSNSGSGSKRRSKGISSGLNLGEHKDILNRIGCLSEEQLAREREKRSPTPAGHDSGGRSGSSSSVGKR